VLASDAERESERKQEQVCCWNIIEDLFVLPNCLLLSVTLLLSSPTSMLAQQSADDARLCDLQSQEGLHDAYTSIAFLIQLIARRNGDRHSFGETGTDTDWQHGNVSFFFSPCLHFTCTSVL
jgi:hypothetical protein